MGRFFVVAALVWVGFAFGQAREQSPLDFDRETYSFGRIREARGAVEHTFSFVNRGSEPVAIDTVVASCGCTTMDFPRRLIQPGERGRVTVRFEPAGYRGDVVKDISVVSGGRRYSNFLKIKAKVK